MADEHQEAVLRKSLDAVDRGRRWAMLGVGAVFVATVLAIGEFLYTAQQSRAPAPEFYGAVKMFLVAVVVQMLLTSCCAAIVVFHGARMTRAILQRIELIRRG
jgi:drug/metabolite transporter (DMT)-like permease